MLLMTFSTQSLTAGGRGDGFSMMDGSETFPELEREDNSDGCSGKVRHIFRQQRMNVAQNEENILFLNSS
jgi:hypothetical protein